MSAPLFYAPDGALEHLAPGDAWVLDGEEGHHAADVRRLGTGEQLRLADGSGRVALATVTGAERGRLHLQVEAVASQTPAQPRYTLVQALAKGDRDLMAIEAATELGVDRVVPWQAERSIVRWRAERVEKSHRKWVSTALAAAKQARRATVPTVAPLADRAAVAALIGAVDLALVLHEDGTVPLSGVDLPERGEIVLIVGPEGGVSTQETQVFEQAGARTVVLGPTVLRSSTAGPAAVAVLSSRQRWR